MKQIWLNFITLLLFSLFQINSYSQNADIDLLKEINLNRNRSLDGTFRIVTGSAAPVSFATPVVMFGIGLADHDSLTIRNSIYMASSVVAAVILTNITKYIINRPRPFVTWPVIEKESTGGSPSFPSGHTSEAFALATSLSLAYPKWYVITPSFIWAGAVGYSRMDLGVHYPSDVLAGAVIGAGCAWISFKVNKMLNHRKIYVPG
jgi:membrane-associated phospholipid phosphatase